MLSASERRGEYCYSLAVMEQIHMHNRCDFYSGSRERVRVTTSRVLPHVWSSLLSQVSPDCLPRPSIIGIAIDESKCMALRSLAIVFETAFRPVLFLIVSTSKVSSGSSSRASILRHAINESKALVTSAGNAGWLDQLLGKVKRRWPASEWTGAEVIRHVFHSSKVPSKREMEGRQVQALV